MKKIILIISALAIFSSLSPAATHSDMMMDPPMDMMNRMNMQNRSTVVMPVFDVMAPVDVLTSQKFRNYADYEKFASNLMMGDNSAYLTTDTGNIFAVYMTLHHEAAIITSSGIKDITTNSKVAQLASDIIMAQSTEVQEMQGLIRSNTLTGNTNASFRKNMDTIMDNMMNKMEMPTGNLTPDQATQLYLKNMIAHHEGAVEMAKAYLKIGKNSRLLQISRDVIATQPKEIDEMKTLLKN